MIRRIVVRSLRRSRICDLARHARPGRGLVLRYHSICADVNCRPDYVSPSISVPVKLFELHVSHLRRNYTCMTMDDVVDHVARRRPLPPRTVALTFDDGYLDNYLLALPVLAKHRMPATIFLVSSTLTSGKPLWTSLLRHGLTTARLKRIRMTDPQGGQASLPLEDSRQRDSAVRHFTNVLNKLSAARRDAFLEELLSELGIEERPDAASWFLSKAQVSEMKNYGVSFGAHTVSHPNLPGIDRAEARREIEISKRELESCVGEQIRHFSYPNSGALHPHVNEAIAAQVHQAGFHSAVTSVRGCLNETTNLFRIPRVGVNRARSEPWNFSFWLEQNRILSSTDRVDTGL